MRTGGDEMRESVTVCVLLPGALGAIGVQGWPVDCRGAL
jgi:hypothetical protein